MLVPHLNPDSALAAAGSNTYVSLSLIPSSALSYVVDFGLEFKELGADLGGDECPLFWSGTSDGLNYDAVYLDGNDIIIKRREDPGAVVTSTVSGAITNRNKIYSVIAYFEGGQISVSVDGVLSTPAVIDKPAIAFDVCYVGADADLDV
jgi:hypothetical protein